MLHQPAIFAQHSAIGTRGGILLLWNEDFVKVEDVSLGTYSLSAKVTIISSDTTFKLTNFYGPTRNNLKDAFFHELVREKPPTGTMWLVSGDFNQIYRVRDKNRANVDRSCIDRFRNALNTCELKKSTSKTESTRGAMSKTTQL